MFDVLIQIGFAIIGLCIVISLAMILGLVSLPLFKGIFKYWKKILLVAGGFFASLIYFNAIDDKPEIVMGTLIVVAMMVFYFAVMILPFMFQRKNR